MSHAPAHSNRLAAETSPYLLQHAHNPVAWQPWGEEALALARAENRPILLSIGYSACHWCHVMAHESFEDPETAAVLNRLFVNIKVDREERPDLDKIYQTAHQLLTGRGGGWPLTVFLDPRDHTPFFAGTYFPREPRHGLPAFTDLCRRVAEWYGEHADDLAGHARALGEAMTRLNPAPAGGEILDGAPLEDARAQLESAFESRHGGFGQAPKFPHPDNLNRLLRHWHASRVRGNEDETALKMAAMTLTRMAMGGLFDQLGGGFCRYSVDNEWMIPHFEKMLYDNALLLPVYADAAQATGNGFYARIAAETGEWALREMRAPGGGFTSALDADSEGEEGRFYTWTREEVEALLSPGEFAVAAHRFRLDGEPNFEGRWYPHVFHTLAETARRLGIDETEAARRFEAARERLFQARGKRVRPGRDDKVLSAWNGLMIRGLARAGRLLGREDFLQAAEQALDFLRTGLWREGRLLASWKDGRARHAAYLDDYVFLADGILELLQARWREGDLEFALELVEAVLAHFEDREAGGFFFTADDHERLIHRPKPMLDEALPSGNGIAAQVLLRLGHLLGETRYLDAAEGTLRAAWNGIREAPYAHTSLLTALEEYLDPPRSVVLRGHGEALARWQALAQKAYDPGRMVLAIPAEAGALPGLLAERRPRGEAIAYLCTGTACAAPVTTLAGFERALEGK